MSLGRTSITHRLSLLFAFSSVLALSGVGAYLYASLQELFAQRDAAELIGKAKLLRDIVARVPSRADLPQIQGQLAQVVVGHPTLRLSVLDQAGELLFISSEQGPPLPENAIAVPVGATPEPNQVVTRGAIRVLAAWSAFSDAAAEPVVVQLELDRSDELRLLAGYRRNLIFGIGVGTLLATGMGFMIARRGLRPLRRMATAAGQISVEQLGERLDVERVPAELKQLALAFNVMLARLEDSFNRLAEFSSDLAHELRTPINNLMGQTQVALSRERSREEYRQVLESNLEEYERLSRMIADMLFLARAEDAQLAVEKTEVDLRMELERVASFYEAHAEECGVELICSGQGQIWADRLLVQRALSNLLSNAIRHTPKGGYVAVSIENDADGVTVTVSNPGLGIAAEHLPRVFDRFYRLHRIEEPDGENGTGLGLAIVKSILELHGGSVTAESAPNDVTIFRLLFPRVPTPAAVDVA